MMRHWKTLMEKPKVFIRQNCCHISSTHLTLLSDSESKVSTIDFGVEVNK